MTKIRLDRAWEAYQLRKHPPMSNVPPWWMRLWHWLTRQKHE